MFDDMIALRSEPDAYWRVTLKVIGPFDNDVVLHCYISLSTPGKTKETECLTEWKEEHGMEVFKDILVTIGTFCIVGYFVWAIYGIIYELWENEKNDDD